MIAKGAAGIFLEAGFLDSVRFLRRRTTGVVAAQFLLLIAVAFVRGGALGMLSPAAGLGPAGLFAMEYASSALSGVLAWRLVRSAAVQAQQHETAMSISEGL